jgi:Cu(I)/Ag(I) efflux system membrane fusion protein
VNKFFILLLTLFYIGELGCNKKEPIPQAANQVPLVGAYQVKVAFEEGPPDRGENMVHVVILSKDGKAIRPEKMEITAVMPAMATMSEMRFNVKPAWQNNESVGRLLLGMGGTWFLDIHFTPPTERPHQARFKLVTGIPGLTLLSGSVLGGGGPPPPSGTVDPMGRLGQDTAGMTTPVGAMSPIQGSDGGVVISPTRLQSIGVKTTKVERHPLTKTIRLQGRVTYDERTRSEVALKFAGFVGDVFVDFIGKPISKGTPLFTVYSPELSATISEYLNLLSAGEMQDNSRFASLIKTARKKLLLWDMTPAQIDNIVKTAEVPQYIPILAPASGIVIDKQVVRGSPVIAGQILYRLADLSNVWIEAQVYESELSLITKGLPVQVTPIGLPGVALKGYLSFISPALNPESRTGAVRIEAKNPHLKLLPEMSVTVETKIALGEHLSVPKDAIIYAGDKKIVFIDQGGGRFIPRFVQIGKKGDEGYEVISGLSEGDRIVTSGNFFIAAESRLTSGLSTFLEEPTP